MKHFHARKLFKSILLLGGQAHGDKRWTTGTVTKFDWNTSILLLNSQMLVQELVGDGFEAVKNRRIIVKASDIPGGQLFG